MAGEFVLPQGRQEQSARIPDTQAEIKLAGDTAWVVSAAHEAGVGCGQTGCVTCYEELPDGSHRRRSFSPVLAEDFVDAAITQHGARLGLASVRAARAVEAEGVAVTARFEDGKWVVTGDGKAADDVVPPDTAAYAAPVPGRKILLAAAEYLAVRDQMAVYGATPDSLGIYPRQVEVRGSRADFMFVDGEVVPMNPPTYENPPGTGFAETGVPGDAVKRPFSVTGTDRIAFDRDRTQLEPGWVNREVTPAPGRGLYPADEYDPCDPWSPVDARGNTIRDHGPQYSDYSAKGHQGRFVIKPADEAHPAEPVVSPPPLRNANSDDPLAIHPDYLPKPKKRWWQR